MLNNKKGLSAIIVTLILILLSIVAVGIVWVVVNNILKGETGKVGTGTACLETNVEATRVVNSTLTPNDYAVTLTRDAGGDEIGGVKLIFSSTWSNKTVTTLNAQPGNIAPLETKTVTAVGVGPTVLNADAVEVVVYFTDDSGNENLCPNSSPFEF